MERDGKQNRELQQTREETLWENVGRQDQRTLNSHFWVAKTLSDRGFGIKFRQAFSPYDGKLISWQIGVHGLTPFDRKMLCFVADEIFPEVSKIWIETGNYPTSEEIRALVDGTIEKLEGLGLKPKLKPLSEYLPRRSPVIFERTNPREPAVVVRPWELEDLKHPKVIKMLEIAGISQDLFEELLSLEIDPKKIISFPLYNEDKQKKEDIVQQTVDTALGKIEVSDCKLYPPAVTGRNDLGQHLKNEPRRGFEAIMTLSGKATLTFPDKVEPIGGLYFGSEKRKSVEMTPGTLAIIPAPTASGWTDITGDVFEFRYISLPPWKPDYVRPVQ